MQVIRIDFHAHLYDSYSVREWCRSAIANLATGPGIAGAVVVVDREGQDCFERLKREVVEFGSFVERRSAGRSDSKAIVAEVTIGDRGFFVIRGVQYVSSERVEVLGIGVCRSVSDGAPCLELVKRIADEGGIPCLPWSPGKWLGARGRVIDEAISRCRGQLLTFGDISIRSSLGPPSRLLAKARSKGFPILRGTDPLPKATEAALVGAYGGQIELHVEQDWDAFLHSPVDFLSNQINNMRRWGAPNSGLKALRRFLTAL